MMVFDSFDKGYNKLQIPYNQLRAQDLRAKSFKLPIASDLILCLKIPEAVLH